MDRPPLLLRTLVGGVATFLAAWWLIGDQSSKGINRPLDYVVRAPDIPNAMVVAAGVVGLVVAIAILFQLVVAARRGDLRVRHENTAVLASLAVGFVAAGSARVITAGSVGANIGAGLAVFGGGAIILWLVGVAFRESRKIP